MRSGHLLKGQTWSPSRHTKVLRRRSTSLAASAGDLDSLFGDSDKDMQDGGQAGRADWEDDTEEVQDAPEMTKEFYSEVGWLSGCTLPHQQRGQHQ